MTMRLTELIPNRNGTLIAFRENRSRDIKYRLLSPEHNWSFFAVPDLWLPGIEAVRAL